MPPFATIQVILEGVGAGLAMVGLGGSLGTTVAVLICRPRDEISVWGQIGTAIGFLLGIPVAIGVVVLLSN
jgi:hypothetical protein